MPDRGAPIGDPVSNATHVTTPQWQSFETRMRHRRADRCLQRAAAALESGRLEEATEALDEASELNPLAPSLSRLLGELAVMQESPAAPIAAEPVQPAAQIAAEPVRPDAVVMAAAPVRIPAPAESYVPELIDLPEPEPPGAPASFIERAAPEPAIVSLAPSAPHAAGPFVLYPPESDRDPQEISEPEPRHAGHHDQDDRLADAAVMPAFVRTLSPTLQLDLEPLEPADLHPLHAREPVDLHPLHAALPLQTREPVESRSWLRATAVGCVALGLSAFAGWLAVTQWPVRVLPAETQADMTLPTGARESAPPVAASSPALDEPIDSPILDEPVGTEAAPDAADTGVPEPTEEPAAIEASPPSREVTREAGRAAPAANVPRTDVESTSGTVPAPVAPSASPPPQLVPRIVNDEPRPPAVPPATDPPGAPAALPLTASGSLPAPPPPAALPEPSPPPPDTRRSVTDADSARAAPAPEAAPRPAPPAVDERAAVRTTLSRYEAAYSELDIAGTRAVWPSVDQRALARAFDGLVSQRLALGTCEVGVNGPSARAICVGDATWTPKVGGGRQTKSRTWTFDLRRADTTWQIVKVDTR